jgi:short-subunit dehydrogenase
MNKTIIIIGAGPGFGMGVAEKFGKEGYSVGLISRNTEKLNAMCEELKRKSIQCYFASANAGSESEIEAAIKSLKAHLGNVSVLLYNAAVVKNTDILEETTDGLVNDFRINVANAVYSLKLLHEDLKSTGGAFLLTGGGLAKFPNPMYGSLALGKAGILNLAVQLNKRLKADGIFVGTITINGFIRKGSPTHSPEILANKLWQLYQNRSAIEVQH